MSRSRFDQLAFRWARWASQDKGATFSFWFLLGWGAVLMMLAALSSSASGVIFMTGLVLVMGAWHHFERRGFIQLIAERRGQDPGSDDGGPWSSADRAHRFD